MSRQISIEDINCKRGDKIAKGEIKKFQSLAPCLTKQNIFKYDHIVLSSFIGQNDFLNRRLFAYNSKRINKMDPCY